MGFNDLTKVVIYSDGASRGNGKDDAVGAYGALLQVIENGQVVHSKEIKQAFKGVTNNQMELMGVTEALELLQFPCRVTVYSDSRYVCDAVNKRWLNSWIANQWKTSTKKPVANQDIWQRLEPQLKKHIVNFEWVKGHADNPGNIKADTLCNEAMDEFLKGEN